MALRALAAIVLLCASVLPTTAQQPVTLRFNEGRVTLRASNAPVRAILAEWARLGGATVVNGERVAGPAMTLELTDVSERQALDVILRGVAGYMLAPRRPGTAGVSAFDRIVILPTSTAPRNPPPTVAAARPRPILPRPAVIARPPEPSLDAPEDPEIEEPVGDEEPAVSTPVVAGPVPRVAPPVIVRPGVQTPDDDDQSEGAEEPDTAAAPTTSANPFGVPAGSSATPGVISPAPKPQQRPTNRVQ